MVNNLGMVFTVIKTIFDTSEKKSIKFVAVKGTKKKSMEQRKQIDVFSDYIYLLSALKCNIEKSTY